MTRRGTTNRNARGGSATRRARKQWLLNTFGDGETAECKLKVSADCKGTVTFETLWVDRIVPGCKGGKYTRDNIQPSCGPCNMADGGRLGAARLAEARRIATHKKRRSVA